MTKYKKNAVISKVSQYQAGRNTNVQLNVQKTYQKRAKNIPETYKKTYQKRTKNVPKVYVFGTFFVRFWHVFCTFLVCFLYV